MHDTLRGLFEVAVRAVDPMPLVAARLPRRPRGRVVVVGAGKASAVMARAVELAWGPPLAGIVLTRYAHGVPCEHMEIVEAGHPAPDEVGQAASQRILTLAEGLTEDDLLLTLISGGGSALLTLPAAGIPLTAKRQVAGELMRAGAPIGELNAVRKHLSRIKGGRLAVAAWPARVLTLAISDVPHDDPATIASGPTVADPTTVADAKRVLERYAIEVPAEVAVHLDGADAETPKSGEKRLGRSEFVVLATAADALQAAAEHARATGWRVELADVNLEGEARTVAHAMAARVRAMKRTDQPCVLLSGGELTVTVHGNGEGGPNAEFALAMVRELDGLPGVYGIACDTDGIDGHGQCAGAVFGPDTLARAAALGLSAEDALANSDAHGFFTRLGDSVVTGPTRTNVNDFRAIIVDSLNERN